MLSLVGEPHWPCRTCLEVLPARAFSRDARAKSGHRGVCKRCDRRATRLRRARVGVDLAIVPAQPRPARDRSTSTAAAAELTIAALDPPAGDADAALVQLLRTVCAMADQTLDEGDVLEFIRCGTLIIRLLRELLATRATGRPSPNNVPRRSKLDAFNY